MQWSFMTTNLDINAIPEESSRQRLGLLRMILILSVPAILSELSTTLMQYIDAGMVGMLGAHATASIGLVESTIWLLDGWAMCVAMGFTVQVAQFVGARRLDEARSVLRQGVVSAFLFGVFMALAGVLVSVQVPIWLGGSTDLQADASSYFLICSCSVLPVALGRLGTGMLQCSGDMRTPSVLNVASCVLDVLFNSLLIRDAHDVVAFGLTLHVPGLGLGIQGAALGTLLAQTAVALLLLWFACVKSPVLGLWQHDDAQGAPMQPRPSHARLWVPGRATLRAACSIGGPMLLERTVMSFAYIAGTVVVAPLGTVSVAANSLAVTAEAVCYMPCVGVSAAATTLVGQAVGARRKSLARAFARLSTLLGVALMGLMGAVMYALAPQIMAMLTPDAAVQALGSEVLRIESFAEPLFGASIVAAGALRGAADTLVPSFIVMGSMWGVRITASWLLAPLWGLRGVWLAMAGELCLRGILFLVRLFRGNWLRNMLGEDRS